MGNRLTDNVLIQLLNVMVLPFKRLYVLLMSLQVGGVSLGSLIIIGVLFVIVISVITHFSGNAGGVFKIFRKDKGNNA